MFQTGEIKTGMEGRGINSNPLKSRVMNLVTEPWQTVLWYSGGQEELPSIQGQWRPGGDTQRLRSGAAERSHLAPKARGGDREEPP